MGKGKSRPHSSEGSGVLFSSKTVVYPFKHEKRGVEMKLRWIVPLLGGVLLVSQVGAEEKVMLNSQKEKISYIMGMDIGKSMRAQSMDIDLESLFKGIRDTLNGDKPLLSDEEIRETMALLQKEIMANQQALLEKNRKEVEAFLAEDKKKEGIVTLPSGLQYKVLRPGTGRKPKSSDKVTIHYRASLTDGTEFDSSYRRGEPQTLQVKEFIQGLAEALMLMQEGAKWLLSIPPNLAYGERGEEGRVGPNATLIFEVELLSIQEGK
jgi:FKBP-type peptidyl-prolyl cis-trans isomerase FklB